MWMYPHMHVCECVSIYASTTDHNGTTHWLYARLFIYIYIFVWAFNAPLQRVLARVRLTRFSLYSWTEHNRFPLNFESAIWIHCTVKQWEFTWLPTCICLIVIFSVGLSICVPTNINGTCNSKVLYIYIVTYHHLWPFSFCLLSFTLIMQTHSWIWTIFMMFMQLKCRPTILPFRKSKT